MKQKSEKREWFIVLGEEGYFKGLINGGKPQWTQSIEEAKPLDNEHKLSTLKAVSRNKELLIEYI
jgi:hypothetical protein